MTVIRLLTEAALICFYIASYCAAGIANGAENMAFFYEPEVQERLVQKGITTNARIQKAKTRFFLCCALPCFAFMLFAVCCMNGARGFFAPFLQMLVILLAEGLFDRFVIDAWWVGKTKAWVIPGTEDLRPYIAGKTLRNKWLGTLVAYPVLAAILAILVKLILH